jgi:cytochrome P450
MPTPVGMRNVDLTDLDTFANGFPHELFAMLRRDAPVFWHEPTAHTPDDEGFWSVSTYDGVVAVLQNPEVFSSHTGGDRPYGGTVLRDLPGAGKSLNMMDNPRHLQLRRLVSPFFTPPAVAGLEQELRAWVRTLLDRAAAAERCDFVAEVAAPVPLLGISVVLGVPPEHRDRLFELMAASLDFVGREAFQPDEEIVQGMLEFHTVADEIMAARADHATADVLSAIMHASASDAEPPSEEERALLFSLMFGAGTETTRSAVSAGLLALIDQPEELERLVADRSCLGTAADEFVRWASPSAYSRRTATRDTTLLGRDIHAGDKVVIWTASANRDEQVFEQPMRLDLGRSPNPHLGFGLGVHHCLGVHLSRLELQVFFDEMVDRLERFTVLEPPEWIRNNRNVGLRRLVVAFDAHGARRS